jgi:hypothetical protein
LFYARLTLQFSAVWILFTVFAGSKVEALLDGILSVAGSLLSNFPNLSGHSAELCVFFLQK